MSESHTGIADEIFVAAGRFIPYFTDAGITHGDIEPYPEDWDAITRALGAEPEGASGANSVPPDSAAPSRIDMEAERLRLGRLGRQIAFYLGTTIIVAVSCAAGWWLGWR